MKFDRSTALQGSAALLVAAAFFGAGFLSGRGDGTPGGFGRDVVTIDSATFPKGAKPMDECLQTNAKCTFAFHFEGAEVGQPKVVPTCSPDATTCLTFSGQPYRYEMHNGPNWFGIPFQYGPEPVAIKGALELYK